MGLEPRERTPVSTYEGPVATCALCERRFAVENIWEHLRIVHGVEGEIAEWPDGEPVIIDTTLEPDDFQESSPSE